MFVQDPMVPLPRDGRRGRRRHAMAWELGGRTLKVYLDVPLEKRQGLPSKVI